MNIFHDSIVIKESDLPDSIGRDGFCILEITEQVEACVEKAKICSGFVVVQSCHTTMALAINEFESGLSEDLHNVFDKLIPHNRDDYRHNNLLTRTEKLDPGGIERRDGHSHCRAILLQPSLSIIIRGGTLFLAQWQSILAFELDGPRESREIAVCVMGE